MAKRSESTKATPPQDSGKGKPEPKSAKPLRQYRSRAEREAEIQRYVIIGTVIAVAVAAVILVGAVLFDQLIVPNQAVASINGQNISVRDFQKRVRMERALINFRINNAASFMLSFGMDPNTIFQQLQQDPQMGAWLNEMQVADQLGNRVLTDMIEDQVVRNEAASRGITVSPEEIQKEIQNFFGYTPAEPAAESTAEATATVEPTATPTPYVSPTPAPTATPTPEATAEATAGSDATITPTPFPSTTPMPTLNPTERAENFTNVVNDTFANFRTQTSLSDADLNAYFELQALRKKVRDAVAADVGGNTAVVDARHILVATEEEANDILDALNNGESFADLARAVSTDTGSGANGGELGEAPVTNYVTEFADAIRDAEIGAFIGPVKTQFGYHIIQVRSRSERPMDENELERAKDDAFKKYLEDAITNAGDKIQRFSTWTDNVPTSPALDLSVLAQ